ncbi:uncharacterized protein PHACADRAFT_82700 [Phanerochaete carnosa HHB-10118-sp]|uniref:Uncharacterized protein n=1 Tax=Phanerochaete carnosa (strain HHB-10118-sp) TaxID=650164 RepID=K5XDJ0_PHACS|nr:uncharacterized protein PHACADRAFT_82700 [Phanerochaete carnosa HHB-10118-sp]EKM61097.1 hypothetical protein PHACADRAFT_82700 [Phanerochaete carnosa HHB-10118-sp]
MLLSRTDTQGTLGESTREHVPESEAAFKLDSEPSLPSHNPIPATTVFARNAAPLSFPQLDAHLAAIPPSSFHSQASKDGKASMFPPLQLLAATKKTLEDLETNSQILPWYGNRNKIFGALTSLTLSITGASALVTFYSLHGLIDILQIFALIVNTIDHGNQTGTWREVFLGTIPNVLALNFATSIKLALVALVVFMVITCVLLYSFYRATSLCCQLGIVEGLQSPNFFPHKWWLVFMSFILTVIYLPLSTMAMHVVVWSDDLWVVPNPYTNATTFPPVLPPLGPPAEFRDPLDFCWTTTMNKNELNYAPVLVILALISDYPQFTVWFPIHLYRVIVLVCPRVDRYTELGTKRSNSDMNREYQRLLHRDKNPLQFLYHNYRRGWATYEASYIFAKLTALLIVAFVDPDNCLFRSLNRTHVIVARQSILLAAMTSFFVRQCVLAPFLDPVSNAGEWISCLNYVLTAVIALCVALNVSGASVLDGPILYIVYGITYGMAFYFTVIDTSFMQHLVKRISGRIDFSIDIFSPRIDLSPSSLHTKRRIWQEAISVLFLTNPECGIPKTQPMDFMQARDSEYPPYLLHFAGTPGERHAENLKILREVGMSSYTQGVVMLAGTRSAEFRELLETIQQQFVGPDCYWKDPTEHSTIRCRGRFGNAWYIPFPPTVVLRYDDGPLIALREAAELELYVKQNSSHDIRRRREVRMALRALDGLVVAWPYVYNQPVGSRRPLCCCCSGRRYSARVSIHYRAAVFRIKRQGSLIFDGLNLGSGFSVEMQYAKGVTVDGSVIGLTDDYDLTAPLARFLALNEELTTEFLTRVEIVLGRYRHHMRKEAKAKADALSYRFLTAVYDKPQGWVELTESSIEIEHDLRVRRLMLGGEDVFKVSYERLQAVSRSELTVWWYLFWDDLWRRNHDTIKGLQTHATDFDPRYPTSIAYTPLPRAALESFLTQRGLLRQKAAFFNSFNSGLLNKIYMRMNDILFHGRRQADIIHLGPTPAELDMEEVDAKAQARTSSLGTGGGTDHDDESIRARPVYRWEGILDDPLRKHKQRYPNLFTKFGVWFGITPLWRAGIPSVGLALDVRLDNGQYVLLQDQNEGEIKKL